jgi:hypothetical protein
MLRRFASAYNPTTHAFSYDSETWTSKAEVNSSFRMYQTYSDGICQHSGDWSITKEFLLDYLASAAVYMLAHPEDEEMIQHITQCVMRRPADKSIAFAHSVVFKESDKRWDKRRYYSMTLEKITASRNAEHDKRYSEISEWLDGTPKAIFRMLIPDYAGALQHYAYADAIREWTLAMEKDDGMYMGLPATFLEWPEYKESDKARNLRYAYNSCRSICESYRLRCSAQTDISNLHIPKAEAEVAA